MSASKNITAMIASEATGISEEPEHECTPEDLLIVHPNAKPGLPIDAIHCLLSRNKAVIEMLMNQFDEPDTGDRCTDDTVSNVLWLLLGDMETLKKLVDHAWRSRPMPMMGVRHD